jgi:hypothetical protein
MLRRELGKSHPRIVNNLWPNGTRSGECKRICIGKLLQPSFDLRTNIFGGAVEANCIECVAKLNEPREMHHRGVHERNLAVIHLVPNGAVSSNEDGMLVVESNDVTLRMDAKLYGGLSETMGEASRHKKVLSVGGHVPAV